MTIMNRSALQQNLHQGIVSVHGNNDTWIKFMRGLVGSGEFELISDSRQREQTLKMMYAEYWEEQASVVVLYKITEKGKTMLDFYEL